MSGLTEHSNFHRPVSQATKKIPKLFVCGKMTNISAE
jgi:hypothetical protein